MPTKAQPWLKFWPELVDHPKFVGISDAVRWTWIKLLARAGQQPTRGQFVSVRHAVEVTGRPEAHIRQLIHVRLLDDNPDALLMHDWQKWQRWRAEDSEEDGSTRDQHAINTGSPNDQHAINTLKREERRKKKSPNGDLPADPALSDPVDEIWASYLEKIQPRARLCPRSQIRARLERFSADELRQGIDHFAGHPWWMEHNADKGGKWFFESDARSEQFLLMAPEPAPKTTQRNGLPEPERHIVDRTGQDLDRVEHLA